MLICEIVSSRHFLLTLVYMDPPLLVDYSESHKQVRCENGCVNSFFFYHVMDIVEICSFDCGRLKIISFC